jgi:hypothetical protein
MTKLASSWKYILADLFVEDRTELSIVPESIMADIIQEDT